MIHVAIFPVGIELAILVDVQRDVQDVGVVVKRFLDAIA